MPRACLSTLLILICGFAAQHPAAAAEPKPIATGDWSKPVADARGYALRGRLVVCEKPRDDGWREAVVYVELQDASDFVGRGMQLYCEMGKHDFRPEYKGGLHCELKDKAGQAVAGVGFAFGGGVPVSEWVKLPCDATIRMRATPFGIRRDGALAICPHLGVLWVIENNDPAEYFLSGSLTIDPAAEQTPPAETEERHVWRGTLDLPPARITSQRP